MRHVGNAGHQLAEFVIDGLYLIVECGDALLHPADFLLPPGGIHSLLTQLRNLGARCVALRLQLFRFGDSTAALLVQFAKVVEVEGGSARRQSCCYLIEIRAEECQIEHSTMLTGDVAGSRPWPRQSSSSSTVTCSRS